MIKAIEKQKKEQEKLSALMQNDPKAYYKGQQVKVNNTRVVKQSISFGIRHDGSWEEYGDINNGKAFAILSSSEISK